jgi:retron-type reverse transcriptase
MDTSKHLLWNSFATYDNFLLAWQRTVNNSSRIVVDDLAMNVFAHNLQANIEALLVKLNDEVFAYEPLSDHKVYVPKPSSTLRTMSMTAPQDLVVYQALVNVIADIVDPQLATHTYEHVWGNLYSGPDTRWMLKPWKELYTGFVNCVANYFKRGDTWIAATDIVSFYDTIDHDRLINVLNNYCGRDDKFFGLLKKCIAKWSAHHDGLTIGRGIPQGSNASDYLANIFLHAVDRSMISNGYHYVRYVDDVRILAHDRSTAQKGLILFDLELKQAGLVAQVTKTSLHEITDIEKEVSKLRFAITEMSDKVAFSTINLPTEHMAEQTKHVTDALANFVNVSSPERQIASTQNGENDLEVEGWDDEINFNLNDEQIDIVDDLIEDEEIDEGGDDGEDDETIEFDVFDDLESIDETEISINNFNNLTEDATEIFSIDLSDVNDSIEDVKRAYQCELIRRFKECYSLLDNPDEAKSAETGLIFCLYRMVPSQELITLVINLLERMPWRSSIITNYIGGFIGDDNVAQALEDFLGTTQVYSWHAANVLLALSKIKTTHFLITTCRKWLTDSNMDWYAKTIAAQILSSTEGPHSFLLECLRNLQRKDSTNGNEHSVLRQQLAYGAFITAHSKSKQLVVLKHICHDNNPLVNRLAIYLLQQPICKCTWNDIKDYQHLLTYFEKEIKLIGISNETKMQCFIKDTLRAMYDVDVNFDDFRIFFGDDDYYKRAVEQLRESFISFQSSPDKYVRSFHQFCHLTIIAFYKTMLPNESGLMERDYSQLVEAKSFSNLIQQNTDKWKKVGRLRNRVDHPIDRTTKGVSKKITSKEVDMLVKEMKPALSEMFEIIQNHYDSASDASKVNNIANNGLSS